MATMALTRAYITAPVTFHKQPSNERYKDLQRSSFVTIPTFARPPRIPALKVGFGGMGLIGGIKTFLDSFGVSRKTGLNLEVTGTMRARRERSRPVVVSAIYERFTEQAIKVILNGQEESRRFGMSVVGTEQILLGLISEDTGVPAKVLKSKGISLKNARVEVEKITGKGSGFIPVEIPFSPRTKHVLELSLEQARQLYHNYIGPEHLLLGLLSEGEGVAARVLDNLGVDLNEIRKETINMITEKKETVMSVKKDSSTPTLKEYGTNLTEKAKEGKLDPVFGREKQIKRVIQILSRRSKNNACLIGEPGVGKTAIAEGLAYKIAMGDIPETLQGMEVISLDMSRIVAGTKYRGEFEGRLQKLIEETKEAGNVILFIDEVHTVVGAGSVEGAIDAGNILKPALARGELQCLGATTLDEYRKHIEKDPALERRFQPVEVPEPTVDEAIQILRALRERYELYHKLCYTDEAIVAAVQLSSQYISDRFLPDKAIDLIDEAGSQVKLRHAELPEEVKELQKLANQLTREKEDAIRNENYELASELRDKEQDLKIQISALAYKSKEIGSTKTQDIGLVVTEADIREIVSLWTGIPVQKASSEECYRLLHMEENLHGRVIGQEEAVKAVSRALRRARVGLQNPNRPIASFIFSGPTGVGKTELAKALTSYYFASEDSMVRFDMSEFMEKHTVSKLIGSPPGYVGYTEPGQLTDAVRRRPYTVLLFDEIEKAHPDVFNIMLQILDDGRLTDSKGRSVNFKNTLIIMTSNVGSNVIEKADNDSAMGSDLNYNDNDDGYSRIKNLVIEELKQVFKPEFLNRLDDMIVFKQLTKPEVKDIADIMLKEMFKRLRAKDITVHITDKFIEKVVDEGYNPSYGARHLRRAITRIVEDFMAEKMLAKEINGGDSVILDVDPLGNVLVLHGSGSVMFPGLIPV